MVLVGVKVLVGVGVLVLVGVIEAAGVALGVLVGVTIAYQAVDRVYDIATLGEHLYCSMYHVSITNIFLVKLNAFLYHM